MNPLPTVGRKVLYVMPADSLRPGEVRPADVVRVNQDTVNLMVQLDGPNDNLPGPDMTLVRWVGSASHDQDGKAFGTWHWMPVQQQGGGFDARIKALEDMLVQGDEIPRVDLASPAQPACQPSIFEGKPAEQRLVDGHTADRPSQQDEAILAIAKRVGDLGKQLAEVDELCLSDANQSSFASRLLRLEEQIRALNAQQPKSQRVAEIENVQARAPIQVNDAAVERNANGESAPQGVIQH